MKSESIGYGEKVRLYRLPETYKSGTLEIPTMKSLDK